MELLAVPAPLPAPTAAAVVGAPTPGPGGAFAGLLTAALAEAPAPVLPANGVAAALPVEKASGQPTLDVAAPGASLSQKDPTQVLAAETPPTAPAAKSAARPSAPRARGRAPAPPDPPSTAPPAPSEKEAPTTAPNAPVPPLDRSSEDETPEKPASPFAAVAAAIPTMAPAVPASPGVLSPPKVATDGKSAPAIQTGDREDAVPATKPVGGRARADAVPVEPGPKAGALPQADGVPAIDEDDASGGEEPAESLLATTSTVPSSETIGALAPMLRSDAGPAPVDPPGPVRTVVHGPELAAAPDLGVVPHVASTPAAPTLPAAPAPAPTNVRIARFAEQATVVAATPSTKVAAPSPKGAAVATAASIEPLAGMDAPAEGGAQDEAPKDPTPQPPAPLVARTAATELPETGSGRPEIDRGVVVRQVADRIENLVAARPKGGVTVHLEPRDLGTVTLTVKGLAHALDVQVSASDDRVRQGLAESRPELAQALAPRGIEIRELRVAATSTTATSADSKGGGSANPQGRARPQNAPPTFPKASRANEDVPARPSRQTGRGVDLLV